MVKTLHKRLIAVIMCVGMLSGTASSYAYDGLIPCVVSYRPDVTIPEVSYDELPRIKVDGGNSIKRNNELTLYSITDQDEYEQSVFDLKIPVPDTNKVIIPQNRFEVRENHDAEFAEENVEDKTLTETEKEIDALDTKVREGNSARSVSASPIDAPYRTSNINLKDSFALQNQTGRTNIVGDNIGDEYIDPLTGNLIVTETDIVLPGIDGFDLSLSRYYSLAQAEVYTKTASLRNDSETYLIPEGWYVVTEETYNTETRETAVYQYAYSSEFEAEMRVAEIETRDTCNGLYVYTAWYESATEGDTITYNYYYTSEITSSSYQTVRNNLGVGWSWCFPSIQTMKDNYNSLDFSDVVYYHDGKGGVFEITKDIDGEYYFSNYDGKDISFEIDGYTDYDIMMLPTWIRMILQH